MYIWRNSATTGRKRTGWITQRCVKEESQNLQEERKTGGQLRWTRGSLQEAQRTLNAPGTGETAAGVQVKEKGAVREGKTEILGGKEKGKKTSITAIKEESRSKNIMSLFVQRITCTGCIVTAVTPETVML